MTLVLGQITAYPRISAILVPLTGLLLPGFCMAYLFLTIEARNG